MNLKALSGKPELIMSLLSGGLGIAQMFVSKRQDVLDKQLLKTELKAEILEEILKELSKNK